MKKVISIILGIMIFAIPVFCFADTQFTDIPQPVIVPQSQDSTSSIALFGTQTYTWRFYSNTYPVYVIFYGEDDSENFKWLAFSEDSNAVISRSQSQSGSTLDSALTNEYDGYYFTSGNLAYSNFDILVPVYNVPYDTLPSNIIDDVSSSVFNVTFDLSFITHGVVSWLSAVVDGVLQAPLLLFLILSSFIGIAVGLLFRFRRG